MRRPDVQEPFIRISSRGKEKDLGFVEIEIFNNGKSPNQEDMENLFVPFYSSKPYGTGFGLPIAQLAAKKNMGELYLERLPHQGTRCVVQLPAPAKKRGNEAKGTDFIPAQAGIQSLDSASPAGNPREQDILKALV